MAQQVVKERSTAYLAASFLDKAGTLAAPAAVSYRVDCITTGTAIRASTVLVAASEVEITLTPDDNRIVDASHATERRRVTVTATYGASDAVNDQYDYVVQNLAQVSE